MTYIGTVVRGSDERADPGVLVEATLEEPGVARVSVEVRIEMELEAELASTGKLKP